MSSFPPATVAELTSRLMAALGNLVAVVLFCILVLATYRITLHPLARIPGPRLAALSSIWHARNVTKGNMAILGRTLHAKYGHAVRVGPNEVWFDTKEAFDQIYCASNGTGKGYEKSDFYLSTALTRPRVNWHLQPWFPDTLDLLSERDMKRYRLQRRLIGRVYNPSNVIRHEKAVDDVLDRAVASLAKLTGAQVDLKEWMHIITVECLGACVLSWSPGMLDQGSDGGTLQHSYQGWRRKSVFGLFPLMKRLEYWSADLGRYFAALWGVTFRTPPNFKPFFPAVNTKVSRRLKMWRRPVHRKDERADLLADLISLHRDKPEFNEVYLRKMAITNFGAGHETMASTLTAAVAMIGSHEDVKASVVNEVRGTPDLSFGQSTSLEYTKAAIREAMRLHPVIGMALPRKTPASGIDIHGLYIPAGTTVGCNPIALHRNEDIVGSDPGAYEPRRWLEADDLRAMEKYSLNWGGGSRSCPGRHLAEMIVLKVVAKLFAEFDVVADVPFDADREAYFLFALSGVKVTFKPATHSIKL